MLVMAIVDTKFIVMIIILNYTGSLPNISVADGSITVRQKKDYKP